MASRNLYSGPPDLKDEESLTWIKIWHQKRTRLINAGGAAPEGRDMFRGVPDPKDPIHETLLKIWWLNQQLLSLP